MQNPACRDLVARGKVGVATATVEAAVGALQASLFGRSKARQHIVAEFGKLVQAQAGHFQKYGQIATQVVEATDHSEPHAQW